MIGPQIAFWIIGGYMPKKKANYYTKAHVLCFPALVAFVVSSFFPVTFAHTDQFGIMAPQNGLIGDGQFWESNSDYSSVVDDDTLPSHEIVEGTSTAPQPYVVPQTLPTAPQRQNISPVFTPPRRPVEFSSYSAQTSFSPAQLIGGDRAVTVNGCGQNLTFGSTARHCKNLTLSSTFSQFLLKNLPQCVNFALRSEGKPSARSIHTLDLNDFSRRAATGSSAHWSMHSTGRAIDIGGFEIELANGNRISTSMATPGHQQSRFAKQFLSCWRNAVQNNQPNCPRKSSRSGKLMWGAITCDEDPHHHHNHFHLALPFCPGKPGIAGT